MPLPAALAARLAKRGLITGSEKHGKFTFRNTVTTNNCCRFSVCQVNFLSVNKK